PRCHSLWYTDEALPQGTQRHIANRRQGPAISRGRGPDAQSSKFWPIESKASPPCRTNAAPAAIGPGPDGSASVPCRPTGSMLHRAARRGLNKLSGRRLGRQAVRARPLGCRMVPAWAWRRRNCATLGRTARIQPGLEGSSLGLAAAGMCGGRADEFGTPHIAAQFLAHRQPPTRIARTKEPCGLELPILARPRFGPAYLMSTAKERDVS